MRDHRVDRVISIGAQIALAALVPASARRVPFTYIESATRVTGISAMGMVMERVPWVDRYVQYPHAVNARRRYALRCSTASMSNWSTTPRHPTAVVTVGGNGDFGY